MTAFVDACVGTVTGSARAVARRAKGKPRAKQLLRALADKKHILVTTHQHADPDAVASSLALRHLLGSRLKSAQVQTAIKGNNMAGGVNAVFAQQADGQLLPWEGLDLKAFDAIVLVDAQPHFSHSPLPPEFPPLAVIDHHRSLGRRSHATFSDIRPDVGATASIIFSYYMELEEPITREMAAMMLFAIESDLAGAAGTPGELDNMALSNLTLTADPRMLYRMRFVDLPQSYFSAFALGLQNAAYTNNVIFSYLEEIDTPEKPAIIADFLLRFEKVEWALVTARIGSKLVLSMRTSAPRPNAADIMRRLVRNLGEGGGHSTKAGGVIPLSSATPPAGEIDRVRATLRRRLLRSLRIKGAKPVRLVPAMKLP